MKQTFLLILLCVLSVAGYAQTEAQPAEAGHLNELVKLELGLHGGGLVYEFPLSRNLLMDVGAGLGMGYAVHGGGFRATWVINDPVAYFKTNFRYMYNREKRALKGKSVIHNTGNYVGFQAKYATTPVFNNSNNWDQRYNFLSRTLLSEFHWGIQRPLGQNFLFNLHLGLGYAHDFDFNMGSVYLAVGPKFSYILLRKSR